MSTSSPTSFHPSLPDPPIKLFGRHISFSSLPPPPQVVDGHVAELVMESVPDEHPSSSPAEFWCDGRIVPDEAPADTQEAHCPDSGAVKGDDRTPLGKTLKKPDKLLPCPRCESLDTKFCYFNNYNVNQPRHFCRKCQRYWTAGGMLRNVPVGAGRRKNKHSVSHPKNAEVSMSVRSDTSEPSANQRCSASVSTNQHHQLKLASPRARLPLEACSVPPLDNPSMMGMLNFGQESPLCKSMAATTLGMPSSGTHVTTDGQNNAIADYGEGNVRNETVLETASALQNRTNIQVLKLGDAAADVSPKDALCTGPYAHLDGSGMASREPAPVENARCESDVLQHFGAPWDHNSNMAINIDNRVSSLPLPNFWPCNANLWAGIPWALMNPALWGPPPLGWSPPWNVPLSPVAIPGPVISVPKHGAEPNGHPLAPKTLRIADPVDAARSSIWSTLGLGGPSSPLGAAFQVNSEKEIDVQMRHVNPAALTRSATLNENT